MLEMPVTGMNQSCRTLKMFNQYIFQIDPEARREIIDAADFVCNLELIPLVINVVEPDRIGCL